MIAGVDLATEEQSHRILLGHAYLQAKVSRTSRSV